MNLEDREFESRPAIAKRTQGSKPAFEWPDDQQDLASPTDSDVKWNRREHLLTWALFWFVTWTGTTIAGSLFGGLLGLFSSVGVLDGLLGGGLWAGAVGLLVFVHLGVIFWALRWLGEPLCLAANLFLKSPLGKKFLNTIKAIEDESLGSMRFTMMDMLLRVTALAVFIAGWSAWLKHVIALHRP